MSEEFDDGAAQIDHDRVNELYEKIAEMFKGEQVFDAIAALEKVTTNVLVASCISKSAAWQVLETFNHNVFDMIEHMDSHGMAAWHQSSKMN